VKVRNWACNNALRRDEEEGIAAKAPRPAKIAAAHELRVRLLNGANGFLRLFPGLAPYER
jgi:hypothetical protein